MNFIDTIYASDSLRYLRRLPADCIDCCVTSPPYYGLRDYGVDGQIGLEETPDAYIARIVEVFGEVRRVLKPKGTLWVNIGDSYAGSGKGAWANKAAPKEVYVPDPDSAHVRMPKTWEGIKAKDLIGIPWMLAFALRADGWFLRQDIIWAKPNPMPESVMDRCTKSHEYIFLLSKSPRYYFDYQNVQEKTRTNGSPTVNTGRYGGSKYTAHPDKFFRTKSGNAYVDRPYRNKRDVWTVPTQPLQEAHFAAFPEKLIADCMLAGCPEAGIVLDPFMGSGTTAIVARKLNRHFAGCELNPEYVTIAERRLKNEIGLFL